MPVKVCGLTRPRDVHFCLELQVDFLGFIFHVPSPRYVSPDQVRNISRGGAQRVGVFVDHSPAQILEIMDYSRLDLVQLHGDYSPQQCRLIGTSRVIKTLWPEKYQTAADFMHEAQTFASVCSYYLLDSGRKGGGHGRTFCSSWSIQSLPRPWFLAGGLAAHTLPGALDKFQPWAIDLNSGLENAPGQKDRFKLQKCLHIWQQYQKKQGALHA